jgi:hypothetical protein
MNIDRIKKIVILFGLTFAQISNLFFWLEDTIPIEEFSIVDLFLIISLFFIILKECGQMNYDNVIINGICLLGALNNFIMTSFFLLWGIISPEKDLAFVQEIGIEGHFQIIFDLISLFVLYFIYIEYRDKIEGVTQKRIIFYEILLITSLGSVFFII